MGKEIVVPKGPSPDSGKTIHRSYTNIRMKKRTMETGGKAGKCYLLTITPLVIFQVNKKSVFKEITNFR